MYRIAIVDDDYMVRESTKAVIERNFKEENFQVECFSTFSQLQSELSQELFTVYILDIELPDGNGLELAKGDSCSSEVKHGGIITDFASD